MALAAASPSVAAAPEPDHPTGAAAPDLRRLARGGSLNLAGLMVYGAANFAIVVVLTRGLGVAGAGIALTAVAAFNILVRTCALGADLGMVRAVSQALAENRPADARLLRPIALVPVALASLGAAAALALAAEPLADALGTAAAAPDLARVLRLLAVALPFATIHSVLESASRGYATMRPSALIEKVAKPSLQLLLVGLGVAFGLGVVGVMALWMLPVLAAGPAMGRAVEMLQRRAEARAGSNNSNPPESSSAPPAPGPADATAITGGRRDRIRRAFWAFARPRALAGTFQVGVLWSDTLLIGALAGTAPAGVYAASTRFLLLGSFVQLAIGQAIQPRIARHFARGELAAVREMYQVGTAWSVLVTWPAFLVIALWAPVLLGVFGSGFAEADTVLALLGAAWLVATACGPVDSILLMAGRSTITTVNLGIALAVDIGLNLLLIPRLGITGAAIAWAVSIVLLNLAPLAQLWRADRLHPFGPGLRAAAPLALACFALPGSVLRAWAGPSLGAMVAAVVAGGMAYLAGLYALRRVLGLGAFAPAVPAVPAPPAAPAAVRTGR